MIRTGIFGGSFNPIHNGHIALALQLKEKALLDEVWLMVSPQNPLKQQEDLLDDTIRLELAKAALKGVEGLSVSDYEMSLPRPSYTWNTLQHLSKEFPDREFVLMIGGDNWASFDRWYKAEEILDNYQIVVYPRRGQTALTAPDSTNPYFVDAELLDISSTEIRQRIKAGRSIRGLVPPAVERMIRRNGYYA